VSPPWSGRVVPLCDKPWCIGHDEDGDHIPKRDHPTIHRCEEYVREGIKCPSFLNHDGTGGTYCLYEGKHAVTTPARTPTTSATTTEEGCLVIEDAKVLPPCDDRCGPDEHVAGCANADSGRATGQVPTSVVLPCGCKVVIGQQDYEAVCEPHRLGQEQDALMTRKLDDVLMDALHAGAVESQITGDEYDSAVAWVAVTQPAWRTAPPDVAMSSVSVLVGEIATTLSLGLTRGADPDELAWDVLHEILECGSGPRLERVADVLLAVRQAMKP